MKNAAIRLILEAGHRNTVRHNHPAPFIIDGVLFGLPNQTKSHYVSMNQFQMKRVIHSFELYFYIYTHLV